MSLFGLWKVILAIVRLCISYYNANKFLPFIHSFIHSSIQPANNRECNCIRFCNKDDSHPNDATLTSKSSASVTQKRNLQSTSYNKTQVLHKSQ